LPPKPPVVGRNVEVATIVNALASAEEPPWIAVTGHAGIGKTTLTLAVLHHPSVVRRYGNSRFFARLETADASATLRTAIVSAIGLNPARSKFRDALEVLATRAPALLVLDNLETPWSADPTAVEEDLERFRQVKGLALMASLRGTDRPDAVQWLALDPLRPLTSGDGRLLFLRIAYRLKPNDPHLDDFIDALGGLPLALTLVARQAAPGTSLELLWRAYRRVGADLVRDPRIVQDTAGRLDALAVSIELSVGRLGLNGHRLFALLGQLPAGIAEEDADALLGDAALEAVRRLRVVGLAEERPARLDLLPPVREHALRHHPPESGDTGWYRHYLGLAEKQSPLFETEQGATVLARMASEIPNVEAAIRWAAANDDRASALKALPGLGKTIINSGYGTTGIFEYLAQVCATTADQGGEARCRIWQGHIEYFHCNFRVASATFLHARDLCKQAGLRRGEAQCVQRLGDIALQRAEYPEARTYLEEALTLFKSEQSNPGEAWCLSQLGAVADFCGEYDLGRLHTEQALQIYSRIGDVQGEANAFWELGNIELRLSNFGEAARFYYKALRMYHQLGDALGKGNTLARFGDLARAEGHEDRAAKYYGEALALFKSISHRQSVGWVHLRLARFADPTAKHEHLEAARDAWIAAGFDELVDRLKDPDSISDMEW